MNGLGVFMYGLTYSEAQSAVCLARLRHGGNWVIIEM